MAPSHIVHGVVLRVHGKELHGQHQQCACVLSTAMRQSGRWPAAAVPSDVANCDTTVDRKVRLLGFPYQLRSESNHSARVIDGRAHAAASGGKSPSPSSAASSSDQCLQVPSVLGHRAAGLSCCPAAGGVVHDCGCEHVQHAMGQSVTRDRS